MSSTRRPVPRPRRPPAARGRGRTSGAATLRRDHGLIGRRRRTRFLLGVCVALALLAGLGWATAGSALLGVRQVTVVGTVRLSEGEVRAAAQVPVGRPLPRVDVDAVARRVAALPVVGSVEVSRRWPHTLHLKVRERTPIAAVPVSEGVVLVDRAGVPFATEPAAPAGVGVLRVDDPGTDSAALRAGVAVIGDLPAELAKSITAVRVDGPAEIVLEMPRGRTAIWGDAREGGQKAAALQALLARDQLTPESGDTFDVSAPSVVTVR